jgi:hypothetical protein
MDMDLIGVFALMALCAAMLGGLIYALVWGLIAPFKQFRKDPWSTDNGTRDVPPMFQKLLDKAMADRDAEQATLKERIATLERIVVDSHSRLDLSGKIDKLSEA